jgi:hypothetical protein
MTKSECKAHNAFNNFNTWETYAVVFDLMNQRKLTLSKIVEIAFQYGISQSVIHDRRRYFLQLQK